MDMNRIDAAVIAYRNEINDTDAARLAFFNGLWKIQNELSGSALPYTPLDGEESFELYKAKTPLFKMAPPSIDESAYRRGLSRITMYLATKAGLTEDQAKALRAIDWNAVVSAQDIADAPGDPIAFVTKALETLYGNPDNGCIIAPQTVALILNSALTPLIETPAKAAYDAIDMGNEEVIMHDRPDRCPVCGGEASLAFVGDTPSSHGRGRALYCESCHIDWEFERIRCTRCGSSSQGDLHYIHIDGDEVHRLHVCDKCNGYTRTVFQDVTDKPVAFPVEDVIMTRLDLLAAQQGYGLSPEEAIS